MRYNIRLSLIKAGSPGTKITGVATTFLATLDVMKKAIIYLGHVVSEEDGMKYLVDDLQNVFPELPVKFIPAGNPFN
jgi:molecular chaperone GrpE (heat shock protein)